MTLQHQDDGDIALDLPNILDTPLTIPEKKLDADHYAADDIDGVTESIFGSGNLAYASLQASQTDAAIALNDALNLEEEFQPDQDGNLFSSRTGIIENGDSFVTQQEPEREIPTDTDRALDAGDSTGPQNISTEGNFSGTTVGALGASAHSFDAGSLSPSSNLSLGDDNSFDNRATGGDTSVNNQTNIVNVDDTVNNVVNTVSETINNITNLGDELVENITNLGDELVENILEGDVMEVTQILTNEVTEITEMVNTQINDVVETVNNFLTETGITEVTNQITEVTNEITETVTNTVNQVLDDVLGGGIAVDLGSGVLDSLGTDLHVAIDDSIAGNIGTGLVSDNLAGLVDGLTGLDAPFLAGAGANIGFDLLGGADANDGADISVAGIELPNIALDPVEAIAGDIDIEIDLPTDLLDPGNLADGLGSLTESLDDLALASPDEILDLLGGQGADGGFNILSGDTELGEEFDEDGDSLLDGLGTGDPGGAGDILGGDLLGDLAGGDGDSGNLLGDLIDTVVDTAENLLEDAGAGDLPTGETDDLTAGIDDAINDAIDMLAGGDGGLGGLGDITGGLTDGDAGDSSWTESTIDAGGLFDDVVGGIGGEMDALPDPGGTVAEGIGALDVVPELDVGSLGGLFG